MVFLFAILLVHLQVVFGTADTARLRSENKLLTNMLKELSVGGSGLVAKESEKGAEDYGRFYCEANMARASYGTESHFCALYELYDYCAPLYAVAHKIGSGHEQLHSTDICFFEGPSWENKQMRLTVTPGTKKFLFEGADADTKDFSYKCYFQCYKTLGGVFVGHKNYGVAELSVGVGMPPAFGYEYGQFRDPKPEDYGRFYCEANKGGASYGTESHFCALKETFDYCAPLYAVASKIGGGPEQFHSTDICFFDETDDPKYTRLTVTPGTKTFVYNGAYEDAKDFKYKCFFQCYKTRDGIFSGIRNYGQLSSYGELSVGYKYGYADVLEANDYNPHSEVYGQFYCEANKGGASYGTESHFCILKERYDYCAPLYAVAHELKWDSIDQFHSTDICSFDVDEDDHEQTRLTVTPGTKNNAKDFSFRCFFQCYKTNRDTFVGIRNYGPSNIVQKAMAEQQAAVGDAQTS